MPDGARVVLASHTNSVNDIATESDGAWLATASRDDQTART